MKAAVMAQMSKAILGTIGEKAATLGELEDDDLSAFTEIVGAFFYDLRAELGRRDGEVRYVDVHSAEARALRAVQRYNVVSGSDAAQILARTHLIEAETMLGVALGVACTGVPDSWRKDGTTGGFEHSGDTCPVHEWLVPEDAEGLTPA